MKLKGSNVKRHFQMIVDNNTYNSMYVTSRSKTSPSFGANRKSTSKNDPVTYDHLEVFRNTWKGKKEKIKMECRDE